jgi:hypothetical protein
MNYYDINTQPAKNAFEVFPHGELKGITRIAFTGTRCAGLSAGVAGIVASSLRYTLGGTSYNVSVGDASGVDQEVIENLWSQPHDIFYVSGEERKDFAQRSVRCLASILPADNAIVLAFPNQRCPARVDTKKRFSGRGSGTWGTVGLALAHGLPVVMYIPDGTEQQKWCGPLSQHATLLASVTDVHAEVDGAWVRLQKLQPKTLFS